jgi:tRNA pseudouridine55 synthase
LAEDIGQALGCGAHLLGLRRINIAEFSVDKASNWQQLEVMSMPEREARLLPLDCMLQHLPMIELDTVQATRMAQGQRLVVDEGLASGKIRLYSEGKFIGLGELLGRRLAPDRLLSNIAIRAATH